MKRNVRKSSSRYLCVIHEPDVASFILAAAQVQNNPDRLLGLFRRIRKQTLFGPQPQ